MNHGRLPVADARCARPDEPGEVAAYTWLPAGSYPSRSDPREWRLDRADEALRDHFEVPTLDGGWAKVTLPEGTQTGRQFRLRGKGMPVLRGGGMHGDLYVEIAVETPVKLCKQQKELLREFEKLVEAGCNPASENWLAKAKSFLNPTTKN